MNTMIPQPVSGGSDGVGRPVGGRMRRPGTSRLARALRAWCVTVVSTVTLLTGVRPAGADAATLELGTATIAELQAAIDAGALSSEKLVQLYLARIEAYDRKGPKLNSVITANPKALEEARALDAERLSKGRRSPMHGIPVVIKDLIDFAGLPTSAGFKPFGNPVPERDAGVVARLRAAGAVIIAKVATVNWFGADAFGPTHPIGMTLNPYHAEYQTGGSSNGTGAAIAAWFATVGVGTDTGGSVQNPAAYCSLAGMVATQGLVTRTGIVPRGPTQDRAGPMARNIEDMAVLLAVMAGWDSEDLDTYAGIGRFPKPEWVSTLPGQTVSGRRIGVLREMVSVDPADAPAKGVFEEFLADLKKAGAQLVDPVLTGTDLRVQSSSAISGVADYELITAGNVYLARLGPNRPYKTMEEFITKVGPEKFIDRYRKALTLPPADKSPDFEARYRSRRAIRAQVDELMERHDLDAVITLYRSTPPKATEPSSPPWASGSLNNLTSTTGLPGVILPGGYTSSNLPVGIQLIGRSFDDLRLLQVAAGVEKATARRQSPASTPPLAGETIEFTRTDRN
jgi:amidase